MNSHFAELKKVIFIDIETISASKDYNELSPRFQKLWSKKADSFKSETALTIEEKYFEKAAITAEFGKVVSIALGFFYTNDAKEICFKTKCLFGHDEKQILVEFLELIQNRFAKDIIFCAHNGKEFDYPYLARRIIINKLPLPSILNIGGLKPWEIKLFDTMDMWKFGDYKSYTSLELLAACFDIPTSKEGIDGALVNHFYYLKNDLTAIAKYCERDVWVLAQIFCGLKSYYDINPKEILFSVE